MANEERVLLTGATGFVGSHLYPELAARGFVVRGATRHPDAARARAPEREFVFFDADQPDTFAPALEGVDRALFLIHQMAESGDYEKREITSARAFAKAAATAGLRQIVYLGGVEPKGEGSRHLRSRIATGEALREGSVPVTELRATMIIGPGSESWRIVRDLSVRLPLMILPAWLKSRSQPIGIDDVCFALAHALSFPPEGSAILELPGPETLTAEAILRRVANLRGVDPVRFHVPFVTPRLSSYWIQLVTRANANIARELVAGLVGDLLIEGDGYFARTPEHRRLSFDVAARRALDAEEASLPAHTRIAEAALKRFAPKLARGRTA